MPLIMAAASSGLPSFCQKTGFHFCDAEEIVDSIQTAGLWVGPRPILEGDSNFRQTIPYIVLRYGDKIVQYTRTASGGEGRLHGRTSIGLGGHIDLDDIVSINSQIDLPNTLANAAARELEEELGITEFQEQRWIGLLVDNESAVGRVHIGVVGLWTLRELPSGASEDAIGNVELCSLDRLLASKDVMETWSLMLLPEIESQLLKQPSRTRAA
ncbi:hypothetical protein [Hyphomonas oceanitis]|uniref:Phosphoesterase (MutT family)-like protein n=1 Tax=Hyphomonas oceanitis SCH89 TaxID=1280953 RepID=A0A059G6M9_9PROT|nr:hypothetical protein [Hyphomonas oceanitis]KDA02487.1 phosphoesterase (MutT family)-like protein [Hyphomonas oceanitis SCH89]